MNIHNSKVSIRSGHALKDGDVVVNHGSLMKIRDRQSRVDVEDQGGGDVVWFQVDFLYWDGFIPRSWAIDFTIQGNNYSTWAVVTDEDTLNLIAALPPVDWNKPSPRM